MSRSNQYEITREGPSNGSPTGEFSVLLNVESLEVDHVISVTDPFSVAAHIVSVQIVSSNLIGAVGGTVTLVQSNDGGAWDDMEVSWELESSGSFTLEKLSFSGKYLGVRVAKGSFTGGEISLHFIVKHN